MRDVVDPCRSPAPASCISCSTSLLLTLMFDIYSHLDTWYVMDRGRDKDGCGRSPDSSCETLLYLLQQANRTHLPPDKELRIVTDKSLTMDERTAVSYYYLYLLCLFIIFTNVQISTATPEMHSSKTSTG